MSDPMAASKPTNADLVEVIKRLAIDPIDTAGRACAYLQARLNETESALIAERQAREAVERELTNAKRFINSKDRPLVESLQMLEEQHTDLQATLAASEAAGAALRERVANLERVAKKLAAILREEARCRITETPPSVIDEAITDAERALGEKV